MVASHTPPTGDLAHNPGMCPGWELNWRPFDSQPALNLLSYTSQDLHVPFMFIIYGKQIFKRWLFGQYQDRNSAKTRQQQLSSKTTESNVLSSSQDVKYKLLNRVSQTPHRDLTFTLPFNSVPLQRLYHLQRLCSKKPSPTSRSSYILFPWFEHFLCQTNQQPF